MTQVQAFAPAKVNLTLHVTGRRGDGYHLLDSLVVFAGIGDDITASPAPDLTLAIEGPRAAGVPTDGSNLVLRAAQTLDPAGTAAITLTKRLPAAAGIGGGSSDAAAALRALSLLWARPLPAPEQTAHLGADVPVCLHPRATRMSGIGDTLSPIPALPDAAILLVNPGLDVQTSAVFAALHCRDMPPMPKALPQWRTLHDFAQWLGQQRNDLQPAAITLCPTIAQVLAAIADTQPAYHAMSGSGATCFGLYPDLATAEHAAIALRRAHPAWWAQAGALLDEQGA
ncbi:MAG: 4-(cytidine 5'-diphospho)-2-C-methyl-D-erythritol kinase [Primorskyibacter sp.]